MGSALCYLLAYAYTDRQMKKVETISITKSQSYVLAMQGIILVFVGAGLFDAFIGFSNVLGLGIWSVVVFVATVLAHEVLHGVGFYIFGAKPKFGIGFAGILPIAYTTATKKVNTVGMLITAYLPLIALSALFIGLARIFPQWQGLAMIGFIVNFSGAVGDIWISSKLWKYLPYKDVKIQDTKSGLEVYSSNKYARNAGLKASKKSVNTSSFGKIWAISAFVVLAIQRLTPNLLRMAGFTSDIKIGFNEFYLINIQNSNSNSAEEASFSLIVPIIVGLVFASMSRAFMYFQKPQK